MLSVLLWDLPKGLKGRYIPKKHKEVGKRIQINRQLPKEELRSTLIHELIHYVIDMYDLGEVCHQELFTTVVAKEFDWICTNAIKYEKELINEQKGVLTI